MSELRQQILAARDIASERINVDAWGVEVEVRGLTGRARAELLQSAFENNQVNLVKMYPMLVVNCTYDPQTGKRIFTDDDLDAVSEKAGAVIEQIATAAARLSGLDGDAPERSKSGVSD